MLKHWGTLLDEPLDVEAAPDGDLIRGQIALPLRLGGFGVADRWTHLLVSDAAARRSAYADLAITCPVASAPLTAAARRRGAAASALRRVKERRYAESVASLPRAEGRCHRFQRFIVESFGHVEKAGLEWFRKCFTEHPVEYLELLRRLSVSLWRYSSSMLAEARHRCLGLHASLPSS
ncbi:hypothetical protein NDN08_000223 [Rhodosorus marinus]|uniref:Uncharacterized protein n=1 Tax=Rhodosorus marinus TaxID=101924 RepID=A0AAV8UEK8_9RHOD|nr:hypothetical protein NDN08_000223 [Rhodosorus marinus]